MNFFVLAEQNVQNVARKVAHATLISSSNNVGVAGDQESRLRGCLDVFRTRRLHGRERRPDATTDVRAHSPDDRGPR